MTRSTILVTGGTGFVGSHFARAAVQAGRNVIVIDDQSGGAPIPPPPGTPLVVADIGDESTVRRICATYHVSAVAHFAGKIQVGESVTRPDIYFDVNVMRSLKLLNIIRDEGVRACLFSSSAAVYGHPTAVPIPESARQEPMNAYGATKLAFEFALEAWGTAFGLRWAALRYFNAAGAHPDGDLRENHDPETHLIPLAIDAALGIRPQLTVFGEDYDTEDGTCVRDYIHVSDLASAHLLALGRLEQGETLGPVNLGTGRGYSVRQIIETTGRVVGRPVPHVVGPRRPGDPPKLIADPTRAMNALAWRPDRSDLPTIIEDASRTRARASMRKQLRITSGASSSHRR
jgi:UDP-glucose-4-epimerase GalE